MNPEHLEKEIIFLTSRSSGPGGQGVNKVNTRVELRFDVSNSPSLTDEEKQRILNKLKNRISREGILIIASQRSRSQLKNKEIATEKFHDLIRNALTPEKKRKPTKSPVSVDKKRLEEKQKQSEKKQWRKPPEVWEMSCE